MLSLYNHTITRIIKVFLAYDFNVVLVRTNFDDVQLCTLAWTDPCGYLD